jgi:Leucine-rich repeat (LRR) protein
MLEKNANVLLLNGKNISDLTSVTSLSITGQIAELDLSQNKLKKLDFKTENQFNKLKVLVASSNLVNSINLNFKRLEVLDLSENKLKKFPDIS